MSVPFEKKKKKAPSAFWAGAADFFVIFWATVTDPIIWVFVFLLEALD